MKHSAFSLVELSIVLVILGLLTGGILTGQSLIRAAELRSVVTELQTYQTAIRTFQGKYFALPGDMNNATDFWVAADADQVTCFTTENVGRTSCNGNGDGDVRIAYTGDTDAVERHQFWKHLENAGLITGSYTGIPSGSTSHKHIPGINTPQPKLSNGMWIAGTASPSAATFIDSKVNVMNFEENTSSTGILKPEEQWSIDKKIDDGRPTSGFIIGFKSTYAVGGTGCTTTADATSEYDLASQLEACRMIVKAF